MAETIVYTGELTVERCWCGIAHAIPTDLARQAKSQPGTFVVYCPLGHQWVVGGKSEAVREREKREAAERRLAARTAQLDQAWADAEHERRRANGYKGAAAKAKKRAAKGVCPAAGCKRSFVDVARHVATCHPDLVDSEVTT